MKEIDQIRELLEAISRRVPPLPNQYQEMIKEAQSNLNTIERVIKNLD